jgi:DNA-binding HxlR family transcriptional regulator
LGRRPQKCLLTRTITAAVPVRVDDELTALGQTILPVVAAIKPGLRLTSTRSTPLETPMVATTASR